MSDYVFFGNQDLGALGYDRWHESRTDPYYDDPDIDPHGQCDPDDYDIDGNGVVHCNGCGLRLGRATKAECDAYDRAQFRAARREYWLDRWYSSLIYRAWRQCCRLIDRARDAFWYMETEDNEEIPF